MRRCICLIHNRIKLMVIKNLDFIGWIDLLVGIQDRVRSRGGLVRGTFGSNKPVKSYDVLKGLRIACDVKL